MKKTLIIFQMLLLSLILKAQETPPIGNFELAVFNYTGSNIEIQLYPVSAVFNGELIPKYTLLAYGRGAPTASTLYYYTSYINGTSYKFNGSQYTLYDKFTVGIGGMGGWDANGHQDGANVGAYGEFGFGVYKLVIKNLATNRIDSCIIEHDYYPVLNKPGDCYIYINNDNFQPPEWRFYYQFDRDPDPQNVNVSISYNSPEGYKLESWRPNGPNNPLNSRPKIYGPDKGFILGEIQDPYIIDDYFPYDARRDCNVILPYQPFYLYCDQNHYFPEMPSNNIDERQGIFTLNMVIKKDVHTPYDVWTYNTGVLPDILIEKGARIMVAEGSNTSSVRRFTLNPYYLGGIDLVVNPYGKLWLESSTNENTKAIIEVQNSCKIDVKTEGVLILGAYSNIDIKYGGAMNLQYLSRVAAFSTSLIRVFNGGTFCNYGAHIAGRLTIQYQGGFYGQCAYYDNIVYDDSTKVILSDGAIFEVPDNTTLYFRDPETVLKMDSNSTIKFGENSKLVFQNGARINAYKANFISSDPNSTWDGIYFEDYANDTIRYCTIENALSGVNIYDRNDVTGETPSTEISNCTFRNSTGNPLTSGIYALNSNNILISNNTFESPYVDIGFSNGILLEYCPSGSLNIINNDIDYSTYGITVIQSSPYIARNTITGRTNSNYGIYLDNSGGSIKYNTISNFNSSLVAYYSSPYVFRNSFANASEGNVELRTYSVPIMKPIIAESDLYWLGGNNTISGNPSTSGIAFYEESYPETDEGYNIDDVNGADYMIGDVPAVLDRTLYATINNWGDEIPDPDRFNVQEGTVDYEPTYDGVTPIQYDNHVLYDIGFGLYDTVYTKDLGDSPGGSILFMQAYNKEMQHHYVNAISLYKQVITSYRKSYFAVASVARIFYCLEKAKVNIGQFLIHQNYLNQIRNNQYIPFIIKELAEDFIVKCKVKRGMLNDAINDYQTIYQQNQNNAKGLHALINKEVLTAMKRDTSDNPIVTSSYNNIVHHKYNLLALLSGNNQNHLRTELTNTTPKDFMLSQNYPNPFNPATRIQYELPNDAFVKIKIYDVLGKEVAILVNGFNKAGRYIVSFNGSGLSSGVYFYKIEAGAFTDIKRMVLIK